MASTFRKETHFYLDIYTQVGNHLYVRIDLKIFLVKQTCHSSFLREFPKTCQQGANPMRGEGSARVIRKGKQGDSRVVGLDGVGALAQTQHTQPQHLVPPGKTKSQAGKEIIVSTCFSSE